MAGANIHVQEITDANINERNSALNMQYVWDNSPLLQGIKKYHCIKVENKKNEGFLLSSDSKIPLQSLSNIKHNYWYEIEYDGVLYPEKITNCINGEFEITTIQPKG
ncbi:hypothetical protein AVEN_16151-1 [Araneus ventricosus]|uniref:Uncharacterized protein n=1 Tax=Araneus ventricosus TaxID=182803 RepID=A0A4Y2RX68_ARAVE|nr:hypothetical protein AVEN_201440-1 [Araneus ventricosus]GBN79570.1 hypothetical protein AVEN_16151-1 [Araneus ventricosus]